MKRFIHFTLLAASIAVLGLADTASAFERTLMGSIANRRAQATPWHGAYYNSSWGAPVALVVPPTAEYQTNWGWGVGATRVTPIYHQFTPGYPGAVVPGAYGFRPTPAWPSDTTQFGIYYVRGPW